MEGAHGEELVMASGGTTATGEIQAGEVADTMAIVVHIGVFQRHVQVAHREWWCQMRRRSLTP